MPRATDMRRVVEEALVEARIHHPDRWIAQRAEATGRRTDHDRVAAAPLSPPRARARTQLQAAPVSFAWRGEEDEVVIEVEYAPDSAGARGRWASGSASLATSRARTAVTLRSARRPRGSS